MGAVTGPLLVSRYAYNPQGKRTYYERRKVYKQAAPFEEKPLPYTAAFVEGPSSNLDNVEATGIGLRVSNAYTGGFTDQVAINRAYDKFVSQVHDNASLGMMMMERREAINTIVHRAGTIRLAWLALRTGNFRKFLKVLDVPPKRKHRGIVRVRSKQAAAYWLEYWFGWSPLLSDIYQAVTLLDSPYPSYRVKAVGGNRLTVTTGYQPYDALSLCIIQADVSVSNEMLYRAQQFGVINPATVAWELVPFSFLVDWFIPIGRYLQSYTDFVGLVLRNAFFTKVLKGKGEYYYPTIQAGGVLRSSATGIFVQRILGTPSFVPLWAIPGRLSVTRAATAVSLLVSLFIKDRKVPTSPL